MDTGSYSATFKFVGSNIYKASTNTSIISIFHGMENLNTSIPFKYSFLIPNYVNVTGFWRVTPQTCGENYYVTGGVFGIVKLPTTRLLLIPTKNSWIEYYISSTGIYKNNKRIGSSIFIPSDNDLSSVLIKVNNDYINITYNGFLTTTVSQVSGLFKHDYHGMLMHDYENIQVIENGQFMMDIFISDPVGYDDKGLRLQLGQGRLILSSGQHILSAPYNNFIHYDKLKFVNTGESLTFSEDMMRVYNFPKRENIITSFSFNGTNIVKPETIGYGLNTSVEENGFEVVQSFSICNIPVSDIIIRYYLEQNNSFH